MIYFIVSKHILTLNWKQDIFLALAIAVSLSELVHTAIIRSEMDSNDAIMANFQPPATRVSFHVQRSFNPTASSPTECCTLRKPIPYDTAITNIGGGMDLSSGIFTAPIAGLYYFSFTGLAGNAPTQIGLFLNEDYLANTWSFQHQIGLKLHSIVNLKEGDQVSVRLNGGRLKEDKSRYTNFIGMFLGSDIDSQKVQTFSYYMYVLTNIF